MAEKPRRAVRILREDVARRIAAGEVIEKPASVVRELMDNAVDSDADEILVEIEAGGIKRVSVIDNGSGMTHDDLEHCAFPHATSKIIEADDLDFLTTLGFRGEALASIAAVSELFVTSKNERLSVSNQNGRKITRVPLFQNGIGTRVESNNLFSDFPARRRFLKKNASETMQCRETFVEKALPLPNVSFQFFVDSQERLSLPKAKSLSARFARALEFSFEQTALLNEIQGSGTEADGKTTFSFSIVLGDPSIRRNDRRQIFIYVNGRRVTDFSLMQAIEYGCQGFFPNGTHPVAALFAHVSPALVDFNIHPAKREIKFKDPAPLHHAVSSNIRSFLRSVASISVSKGDFEEADFSPSVFEKAKSKEIEKKTLYKTDFDFGKRIISEPNSIGIKNKSLSRFLNFDFGKETKNLETKKNGAIRYVGRTMETFILAEKNDSLFVIDQHAVHERLLFDEIFSAALSSKNAEPLLIPYKIQTDDEETEAAIGSALQSLSEVGFSGRKIGDGEFEFNTVSEKWTGSQEDFKNALLSSKNEEGTRNILYRACASAACRKAVMAGTPISDEFAKELSEKAFLLPDPHCPHGRPVFFTLSRAWLYEKVRRTE